jgi:hypothetical protein
VKELLDGCACPLMPLMLSAPDAADDDVAAAVVTAAIR